MRISVITINFDNARGLERTIASVERQIGADFEYIVVDGASSDGSDAVLRARGAAIDKLVAERDTGPFQAMNKGMRIAEGDYLLFLNSGDELARDDSLAAAIPFLAGSDIYYADAVFSRRGKERAHSFPDEISLDSLLLDPLNHQNLLIGREYLSSRGGYDERFKIVSDWGFMVKAFLEGPPSMTHIHGVVSKYYLDGMSSARSNRGKTLAEKRIFLESMDPAWGHTLSRYVELCGSEYQVLRSRFRRKALFDGIMAPPLLLLKALARIGL